MERPHHAASYFIRLTGLLLLALTCVVGIQHTANAATTPSVNQLLSNMASARHQLNYAGRFVYVRGGHISSLSILHVVQQGKERACLTHLDGPLTKVVNIKGHVIYVRGDNKAVELGSSPNSLVLGVLPDGLANNVPANYVTRVTGGGRVAGRPTWQVTLWPKDRFRYGYQLWLDKQSKLLLRFNVRNTKGALLEQIEFTSLTLNPNYSNQAFAVPEQVASVHSGTDVESKGSSLVPSSLIVGWLPDGFTPIAGGDASHPDVSRHSKVGVVTYTDGLASFSLFVAPADKPVKPHRIGAVQVMGRVISSIGGNIRVTLVGGVPKKTASRILDSLSLP